MENLNTNETQGGADARDCVPRLVRRLRSHIAIMAPHQKEREGGKLIVESYEAIEELRQALIGYIPSHSGACCELVDDHYRATERKCSCDAKDKRARDLTEHDLPLPNEKVRHGGPDDTE